MPRVPYLCLRIERDHAVGGRGKISRLPTKSAWSRTTHQTEGKTCRRSSQPLPYRYTHAC